MQPAEFGAMVLMGVFGIGVMGCLATIPLCAYKFFRVLVETDAGEEQVGAQLQPVQPAPAAAVAVPEPQSVEPPPARGVPALAVSAAAHSHGRRVVPKRFRRPRRTAGRLRD
jgi:hypothetical protein